MVNFQLFIIIIVFERKDDGVGVVLLKQNITSNWKQFDIKFGFYLISLQ